MILNWLRGAYENPRVETEYEAPKLQDSAPDAGATGGAESGADSGAAGGAGPLPTPVPKFKVLAVRSPLEDYAALTQTVGLSPSLVWALIGADGPDAVDYLHRRMTRALKKLIDREGCHALQLEGDGRLSFESLVYRGGRELMFLVPRDSAEAAHRLIEKYVITEYVTASRLWDSEGVINLIGPAADALVERLATGVTLPPADPGAPWRMLMPAEIGGVACRVFRDGRWPVPFYHLAAPYDELPQLLRALDAEVRAAGGAAVGVEAFERLRIESAIPAFGVDADAGVIPLEAGLADAVDYDKGCFPGQEFLARIRNLGHPARLLAQLELVNEYEIERDAVVQIGDDDDAGRVTSSAALEGSGKTVALARLKWAHRNDTEARVAVDAPYGGFATARIVRVIGKDDYKDKPER